jgi:uncharacterized membrane protein (GlpM family)
MILLLKVILPSCLVALVSLAGRRWGLKVGGAIGGFPVVVGPILFFFALEQGTDFAAHAALRSLWGMLPFGVFCLTLSWAGLRLGLGLSMVLGWAVFVLISWLGLQGTPNLTSAALLAAASGAGARFGLPKDRRQGDRAARPSNWDIPLRMSVTVCLVLAVTGVARALGPEWSGVLAAFPVATSILAGFAYISDGPYGPPALLQGSLLGGYSYVAFCATLAFSLPRFSLGLAFLAAFTAAIGIQIAALSLDRVKR